MNGHPRRGDTPCSGIWACEERKDGLSHCVCWWDARTGFPQRCCQCGEPSEPQPLIPGTAFVYGAVTHV